MTATPRNFQYLHGITTKTNAGDAVVCTLQDIDTGETKLKIIRNPKRNFYVTKKKYQHTHESKKEYAPMSELDTFTVENSRLRSALLEQLGYSLYSKVPLKVLLNSPYVYGADIDIDVLVKQAYLNATEKVTSTFSMGAVDIETSVTKNGEIILMSYVDQNLNSYCAMLESFSEDYTLKHIDNLCKTSIDKMCESVNEDGAKVLKKKPLGTTTLFKAEDEISLLKWIFDKIHKTKPSFVGVWNVDFDMPCIVERIEMLGYAAEDIICHPEVPLDCRYYKYHKDENKKVAHISRRWHYVECAGYTQYFCAMAVFSILRTVEGVRDSYKLKETSDDILGITKLDFGEGGYAEMETKRFDEYVAYNIVDSLLVVLLNEVTNDVTSMYCMC